MKVSKNKTKVNFIYISLTVIITTFLLFHAFKITSFAETVDYEAAAQERKNLPIQSNSTLNWPEGPEVSAESAIVMEVNTGTILYAKNIHEELYPASTTKIMTCLLAVENASLSDTITFSNEAVFSVPNDGSSIGMDVGESISLEQALYGIMVGSANEVANAVGEHVSGSIDAFVSLMNEKATSLGATNTHFANPNGLQDENHYTSVYDLALISSEFFSNELLCNVANTPRYHFEPTATQPDDFYLNNKHKLITGEIAYDGIVGGKTGYTDLARETLVTCAERDGMKLVCIVFMEESPTQFIDTVTLFDYAFNNFQMINVSDNETRYMPDDSLFFESENDVFGKSGNILSLSTDSSIIIPKTATIADTDYEVSYEISDKDISINPAAIAKINYTYSDVPVGSALLCYSTQSHSNEISESSQTRTYYINVKIMLLIAIIFALIITIAGSIISRILHNRKYTNRSDRIRYNRRKREYKKRHFKNRL